MNQKQKEDRFFDRAQAAIPKGSVLISACGVFNRGNRRVSFTYRHCGRVFTTTLQTEGGEL